MWRETKTQVILMQLAPNLCVEATLYQSMTCLMLKKKKWQRMSWITSICNCIKWKQDLFAKITIEAVECWSKLTKSCSVKISCRNERKKLTYLNLTVRQNRIIRKNCVKILHLKCILHAMARSFRITTHYYPQDKEYIFVFIKRKIDLFLSWDRCAVVSKRLNCCYFSHHGTNAKENRAFSAFFTITNFQSKNLAFLLFTS